MNPQTQNVNGQDAKKLPGSEFIHQVLFEGVRYSFGAVSDDWVIHDASVKCVNGMAFMVVYSRDMHRPEGSFTRHSQRSISGYPFTFMEVFVPFPIGTSKIGGFYVVGENKWKQTQKSDEKWVNLVMQKVLPCVVHHNLEFYGVIMLP